MATTKEALSSSALKPRKKRVHNLWLALGATIMADEGKRTLRQKLVFNIVVLICALPVSFLLAAVAASGTAEVSEAPSQNSSKPSGSNGRQNRGSVERGEFVVPGGAFSKVSVDNLEDILDTAVSTHQHTIDAKALKHDFIRTESKVRLLLILSGREPYSYFFTTRTVELCVSDVLICAILDLEQQGDNLKWAASSPIPIFDLVESSRLEKLSALIGLAGQSPSGLYVFDIDGKLIWFGPEKSKVALSSVVEVVVRTLLSVKRTPTPVESKVLASDKEDSRPVTVAPQRNELGSTVAVKPPQPDGLSKSTVAVKPPQPDSLSKIRLHDLDTRLIALKENKPSTLKSSWAVKTAKAEGKAVILMFWATWCHACVVEIPDLAELNQEYGEKVMFIGLAQEFNKQNIRELMLKQIGDHKLNIQYIAEDGAAFARKVFGKAEEEDVALPAFAIFNAQGELVDRISGTIKDKENLARLRNALDLAKVGVVQKDQQGEKK